MQPPAHRPLNTVEQALLDALKTVRPGLDEEEATQKILEASAFLGATPHAGLMVAGLAADNRVDAKPKVQLTLLTLNTALWGPARIVSRLLSTPASWFVGPTAFFNDVVGALYGFFRLTEVLHELEDDLLREHWRGEEEDFLELLENLEAFHTWALDNKIDRAFKVLSWIP